MPEDVKRPLTADAKEEARTTLKTGFPEEKPETATKPEVLKEEPIDERGSLSGGINKYSNEYQEYLQNKTSPVKETGQISSESLEAVKGSKDNVWRVVGSGSLSAAQAVAAGAARTTVSIAVDAALSETPEARMIKKMLKLSAKASRSTAVIAAGLAYAGLERAADTINWIKDERDIAKDPQMQKALKSTKADYGQKENLSDFMNAKALADTQKKQLDKNELRDFRKQRDQLRKTNRRPRTLIDINYKMMTDEQWKKLATMKQSELRALKKDLKAKGDSAGLQTLVDFSRAKKRGERLTQFKQMRRKALTSPVRSLSRAVNNKLKEMTTGQDADLQEASSTCQSVKSYLHSGVKAARATGRLAGKATSALNAIPVVNKAVGKVAATKVGKVAGVAGKVVGGTARLAVEGADILTSDDIVKEASGRVVKRITKKLSNSPKAIRRKKRKLNRKRKRRNKRRQREVKAAKATFHAVKAAGKATVAAAGRAIQHAERIIRYGHAIFATVANVLTNPFVLLALGIGVLVVLIISFVASMQQTISGAAQAVYSIIMDSPDNLSGYVDTLNGEQSAWRAENVDKYERQAGHSHGTGNGQYKDVTIQYDGSPADNKQELLSMVAVMIDQDWPNFKKYLVNEALNTLAGSSTSMADLNKEAKENPEMGTPEKMIFAHRYIKTMLAESYKASHHLVSVVESEEKPCNERCQIRIKHCFNIKAQMNDLDRYADEQSILYRNLYESQGGCYKLDGVLLEYNCLTDKAVIDLGEDPANWYRRQGLGFWNTAVTDRTLELENFSASVQAGQITGIDIAALHAHAGKNDVDVPAREVHVYGINHPVDGCTDYHKATESHEFSIPGFGHNTCTVYWNEEREQYGMTYMKDGERKEVWIPKSRVSHKNTDRHVCQKVGTDRYIFKQDVYLCNERTEAKCYGHTALVDNFRYCRGHQDHFCKETYKDLTVTLKTDHFDELFLTSPYDNPKRLEAKKSDPKFKDEWETIKNKKPMEKYPNFAGWTNDNRQWAKNLFEQDWDKLYGISLGGDVKNLETDPLSSDAIENYMNLMPEGTSQKRKKIVEYALRNVGRIHYYWGGTASYPKAGPLEDNANQFGKRIAPDEEGRSYKGLDCSHFVDWVYWSVVNDNLGNGSTVTLLSIGQQVDIASLKPGDLGLMNASNSEINHVGIYVGKGHDGKPVWVHCTGTDNKGSVAGVFDPFVVGVKMDGVLNE